MNPMTTGILVYLDRYLKQYPKKQHTLADLHLKRTGDVLHRKNRWNHTSLRREPLLSTGLVYLEFLVAEGHLIHADQKEIFRYKNPAWLKRSHEHPA